MAHCSWMSPSRRPLALASTLVALASPAGAAPTDVFTEDVQVRLVNVDVVVTDKDGRPIGGLERQDFEVLVDGEPVTLTHFARAGRRSEPLGEGPAEAPPEGDHRGKARTAPLSGAESPRPALERRLNLILYLDRSYLGPGDLKDLGIALRQFLDREMRPGDRVMLVSADRRVEVLQKLTTLTSAIDPLFARELAKLGRGQRIESEYRDILRSIDQTLEEGADLDARHPEHHSQALLARINAFSEEAYRDVEITGAQLRQVISGLAGVPGRKVVLYIGGRMPVNAGQALFSAWQSAFGRNAVRWQNRFQPEGGAGGGGAGGGGADDPAASASADGVLFDTMAGPDSNLDAGVLFERAARHASSFGVRFYTLDASALRTSAPTELSRGSHALAEASGGTQWELRRTQRVQSQSALGVLAEVSGGRGLSASRDFASLFSEMRYDLDSVYSLGFDPPEEAESTTHRIEVKLRSGLKLGRKTRIRHRQYYQSRSPDQEAAETTLSALLLGSVANPLGVEVSAGDSTGAGGEGARVPLLIKVPLSRLALLAETHAHNGQLSVFVTSGDFERGAAPIRRAVVPVRIANDDILNVFGRRLEYALEVEVPRGSRTIAVGVRDDFAPLISTVTVPIAYGGPQATPEPSAAPGNLP